MSFSKKMLTYKSYATNETLLIIKQVQIIDKNDIIIAPLNVNNEMFMLHIAI